MKNHRVIITKYGDPEVLKLIEEEIPEPKAGEALVQVQATGIAFGDVLKRKGLIPGMPRLPYTPGYDLTGRIARLGSGVSDFNEGDRVVAFLGNFGHTEWACVPASKLVRITSGAAASDPSIAASLILNYISALQMLEKVAHVKSGDRILVHGAAGGAGTAFLQIAKIMKIEAYGTASAPKHDLIRKLGGIPIDYKNEDFVKVLLSKGGATAVFDPIGGAHLARSRAVLQKGGRLVVYGTASSVTGGFRESIFTLGRLAAYKIIPDSRSAHFFGIESWPPSSNSKSVRHDLSRILDWHGQGKLDPIIGATFPLKQVSEAYRLLESSRVSGKIVLLT